ncbi:MAG: hypothetical protein CMF49_03700 [Legionellales bacterium]|nr:hypothetical protein [Legionellales bacterium]|tara:strand:- start:216 stop:1394 length:1179 start_codon:yes stop_codon:yes gene_type:complete
MASKDEDKGIRLAPGKSISISASGDEVTHNQIIQHISNMTHDTESSTEQTNEDSIKELEIPYSNLLMPVKATVSENELKFNLGALIMMIGDGQITIVNNSKKTANFHPSFPKSFNDWVKYAIEPTVSPQYMRGGNQLYLSPLQSKTQTNSEPDFGSLKAIQGGHEDQLKDIAQSAIKKGIGYSDTINFDINGESLQLEMEVVNSKNNTPRLKFTQQGSSKSFEVDEEGVAYGYDKEASSSEPTNFNNLQYKNITMVTDEDGNTDVYIRDMSEQEIAEQKAREESIEQARQDALARAEQSGGEAVYSDNQGNQIYSNTTSVISTDASEYTASASAKVTQHSAQLPQQPSRQANDGASAFEIGGFKFDEVLSSLENNEGLQNLANQTPRPRPSN